MRNKISRHTYIRELLGKRSIGTHEELSMALQENGIRVSQATLSKDLRELGVIRVPQMDGSFCYTVYNESDDSLPISERQLTQQLEDNLFGADQAASTVVLKTRSGFAQSVCESIDKVNWKPVVGTLAGENTVFIATRSENDANIVLTELLRLSEKEKSN